MIQTPMPGERLVMSKGDCLTFRLDLDRPIVGEAFLRTNLGRGKVRRQEVIAFTERKRPVLHTDWHDLPMRQAGPTSYSITLPLLEVGCFEAKAWFQPADGGKNLWASGRENTKIKIEPAGTVGANFLYTLFPRQFGPNKLQRSYSLDEEQKLKALDEKGYSIIPKSGTFRDVIKELDFIIGRLRCRIIQLLPVHPTPTVYGRMGRFGSPFAALDFFSVDPECAEFDPKATPMEQFGELVDAIHARNAKVFIDIPVNHTGWASRLQTEHPEWFERQADGTIVSPGAWGVVWADLCKLNYRRDEVHRFMAEVFLFWCRHGIDGFRCDAGYMIPFDAWEYIVAKVRTEYPNTIFMLEGLGGPLEVTSRLLGEAGLNWAYSELFQNYDRGQISYYLPGCIDSSMKSGVHVHFAETHDNNRLAAKSPLYSRLRTALSSMLSHNGAFGITNGVEWYADTKVLVHGAEPLRWGSHENQVDILRRLYAIMETHPVFYAGAKLELIQNGEGNTLAMLRTADAGKQVLVAVNLDETRSAMAEWPSSRFDGNKVFDLISGRQVDLAHRDGKTGCHLDAGQVACLSASADDMAAIERVLADNYNQPERVIRQEYAAMAMELNCAWRGYRDCSGTDFNAMIDRLQREPRKALAELCGNDMPPVTTWTDGHDQRRQVMVPHGDFVLFQSSYPFRFEIKNGDMAVRCEDSLPLRNGGYFYLLPPLSGSGTRTLHFTTFQPGDQPRKAVSTLLLLSAPPPVFRHEYNCEEAIKNNLYAVGSNLLGGMMQVRAAWGEIASKYDGILAANCHVQYPVDRTVMFTRCRAWLVYRDYSQEISKCCLTRFRAGNENSAQWDFLVPSGQGRTISLRITATLSQEHNYTCLNFHRLPSGEDGETVLDDSYAVRLVLRPDIEDRSNHSETKAFLGAESHFRRATVPGPDGFYFNPSSDHALSIKLCSGRFVSEPEWSYMVGLPFDSQRGMDGHTDLYSPGYFDFELRGGESRTLVSEVTFGKQSHHIVDCYPDNRQLPGFQTVGDTLRAAVRRFVVKRDDSYTVIAGYPWFLDWGRDTLICLRGLISAGFMDEARNIIREFARFEKNGTLPNMIRGNDDSNRDTTDAPLWMFVAVHDFIRASGNASVLELNCNGRPLSEVLISIAKHYRNGTPNGIIADPASGLIFSPSHYTWMDTNHPAGTPREGYPIEIQALWHAALELLAEYDPYGDWAKLAEQVRKSIMQYYPLPTGYLSDCLHAGRGQGAATAVRDDALRPNQLYAVTLGAVTDRELVLGIIRSCEKLLIPGAIRSLADQPVSFPMPVFHQGCLLNDPSHPYWGHYAGDEDTRRKPAYHNGTAWTWQFPAYCEALMLAGGSAQRQRALMLLLSARELIETGCVGQMPEIVDGDYPHEWRGCGAQAWGVTEVLRVYQLCNHKAT